MGDRSIGEPEPQVNRNPRWVPEGLPPAGRPVTHKDVVAQWLLPAGHDSPVSRSGLTRWWDHAHGMMTARASGGLALAMAANPATAGPGMRENSSAAMSTFCRRLAIAKLPKCLVDSYLIMPFLVRDTFGSNVLARLLDPIQAIAPKPLPRNVPSGSLARLQFAAMVVKGASSAVRSIRVRQGPVRSSREGANPRR